MMSNTIPQRQSKTPQRTKRSLRDLGWGMGSVRPTASGKWQARWYDDDGTKRGRTFLIQEEAEDFLRALSRAKGRISPEERRATYDGNFVYFIQADRGGPIKIGHAGNPAERLKSIQAHSPVKVRLLAIIDGGVERELALHKQFAYLQMHNEWFRSAPELRKWIRENAEPITTKLNPEPRE